MPEKSPPAPPPPLTYKDAGVDTAAGLPVLAALAHLAQRTRSTRVLGPQGLFRLDYNEHLFARNYKEPVLVAATSGVGTKLQFATQLQKFDTVGIDLVAMNVNDLIVHGAEPLFFLHHLSHARLQPPHLVDLVKGISDGCVDAGCALLGSETAEMPHLYGSGDFNLAGFAVGVIEKSKLLDTADVEPGDSVIGLASSGLHSNGYALVRHVITKTGAGLHDFIPELKCTLAEELLRPTRLYVRSIQKLLGRYKVKKIVKAMAHVAGGGLAGAVPRLLPQGLSARLKLDAWTPPPIFPWLQQNGPVDLDEMLSVFNMGIGFVLVVRPTFTKPITTALRTLGEKPIFLGKIRKAAATAIEWS
jgi:phosphoribosylformylglycinamidine cyclo-ligase